MSAVNGLSSAKPHGGSINGSQGDAAVSGRSFRNAMASQEGGGNSFLTNVLAAAHPKQKLALIEGFAAGYADAVKSSGNTLRFQPVPSEGTAVASPQVGSGGSTSHARITDDPQATMAGYKALAEQINDLDMSTEGKNKLLDDVGQEMAKLRDAYPPGSFGGGAGTTGPDSQPTQIISDPGLNGSSGGSGSATNGQDTKAWQQEVKDGVATIHLGDEYTLNVSENGESVTLSNNWTGGVTKIWGDPHIDVGNDGKNDFDFHDGMTMKLDNGIEIRLGTLMDGGAAFTTSLTVLQGDRAMQVTGIAGDRDGKNNLSIVQSNEGRALANLTPNGAFVIREAGKGWETTGGNAVTQQFITDSEALYEGRKKNQA